jgi:hypothetical protein
MCENYAQEESMADASPRTASKAGAKISNPSSKKPNVVYFLVDNLGMGELSSYVGGPLRGVSTTRIDAFAQEGMMLLDFAPELNAHLHARR